MQESTGQHPDSFQLANCEKDQEGNTITTTSWKQTCQILFGDRFFSTPFGNEAWNLTNVVSTLVMGRVPRYSNNHNCSLDLFFLQLICGWGEKNHPWVWLNIGYPPVIKHGNWTSSINGGVHGKIHNGGLSVAKFDYQRLPAKLPGDQTIWVAGFQRTPRKKDPVDNWNKHVGNQLISLHFWRVLMSDGSPSTSDQLRDQTWSHFKSPTATLKQPGGCLKIRSSAAKMFFSHHICSRLGSMLAADGLCDQANHSSIRDVWK